jgi:hypothetical protein
VKTLTHCPKCKGPLLSNWKEYLQGGGYWTKDCWAFLDHKFFSRTQVENSDDLFDAHIAISMSPFMLAIWNFKVEILHISKFYDGHDSFIIPYFEPDFSDYKKLINKLSTYITFS